MVARTGQTEEGRRRWQADIAGAKAIQADVAEKFARYDVTPSATTAR
jgi:hypothetical protein